MCDYSLHLVSSRPAEVGEKLVSTAFKGGTRGFAAVNELTVAVCLLPGTEVAFEGEIKFNQSWSFFHKQKSAGTVARFRQINLDNPNTHHDALELADGRIVHVNALHVGQRATVLQLPTTQQPAGDVPSQAVTVDRETHAPARPTLYVTEDGFFR